MRVQFAIGSDPEFSQYETIHPTQPAQLMPFVGNPHNDNPRGQEFYLKEYLALVDWNGRAIRNDKRGGISSELPPILQRLQINPKAWLQMTTGFESRFSSLVGQAHHVQAACEQQGQAWAHGISACRQLFPT